MNVRQEYYRLFLFSASFSFPHPENCHIIFVFSHLFFPQPQKLSKDTFMLWIKSILILSLITLCVNCRCFICLPCLVPCFFLWHGFPFCLLSWTASHSMPPQVQNQGLFLPLLSSTYQSQARQQLVSQNMQSIPGVSQNSVGNSMGQGIPSTMFANSQRQMPGNALFGSFMCHCFHTCICNHTMPNCYILRCTNCSPLIIVT